MIAAVVALALAVAGCVPALIWYAHRLNVSLERQLAAGDALHKEYEMAEEYLKQRDILQAQNAILDDANRNLTHRLYQAELAANRARKEYHDAMVERIETSNLPGAARIVDELLKATILPAADETDADGDGGA